PLSSTVHSAFESIASETLTLIDSKVFGLVTVIFPLTTQPLSSPLPLVNVIVYLKLTVPPVWVTFVLFTVLVTLQGNLRVNDGLAVLLTSTSLPTQTSTVLLSESSVPVSSVTNAAVFSCFVQVPAGSLNSSENS